MARKEIAAVIGIGLVVTSCAAGVAAGVGGERLRNGANNTLNDILNPNNRTAQSATGSNNSVPRNFEVSSAPQPSPVPEPTVDIDKLVAEANKRITDRDNTIKDKDKTIAEQQAIAAAQKTQIASIQTESNTSKQNAQATITAQQAHISELEKDKARMEGASTPQAENRSELQKRYDDLQAAATRTASNDQTKINELQGKLTDANTTIAAKDINLESLRKDLERRDSDIARLNEQITGLQNVLDTARNGGNVSEGLLNFCRQNESYLTAQKESAERERDRYFKLWETTYNALLDNVITREESDSIKILTIDIHNSGSNDILPINR